MMEWTRRIGLSLETTVGALGSSTVDPVTRLRQAEALFHDALQQPAAERAEYVRRQCGDDQLLLRNVEQLLDADAGDGDFLSAPALGQDFLLPTLEELRASSPRQRIGPYQLVRLLGSGGIGHVWLARRADEHFSKLVALKLIKRGMDTDAILRRFRHERQVLARLEHASIARLIDGGATDDGLPYLVMEYVDGVPIDRFCHDRQLDVTQRLDLFGQVCSAVQHAHQNLVVHRDLKPGNILVTADGQPKLLDFGIARVLSSDSTSEGLLTTAEQRILTPEYASPEQIQGGDPNRGAGVPNRDTSRLGSPSRLGTPAAITTAKRCLRAWRRPLRTAHGATAVPA